MEIPFEIKQAMEVGNAILFVGAGMGFNMLNEEGEHAPDSHALARMIADRFDVPVTDDIDLAKVSQYVCAKKGSRSELTTYIRSILAPMCPDSNMHWIASVKWKAVFTTNYDNCIEKAYDCFPNPVQNYSVVTHLSGIKEFYHDYEVPIVHLHGSLFAPSSPEIIITQQDYIKYNVKRKSLFDMLKHYLATSCVLYTGYSHNDSNFMTVLSDLAEEMYPSPLPTSYRIDPNTSEVDKFLLEQQNIYSINLDFSDFVSLAKEQLQCRYTVNEKYGSLETHVPEKFIADYQKNPLPFVRLYSSWEYVAQIIVNSQVTVHDFLRGEKADWGIIYNDFYFKRTIEENIYESILDHVTAARNCVNSIIILSPAGYGKSTLLKSLTKDISKENIADVYFFHSEKEFRVGDVFFACECTPDTKHIFFIDDAANNISEIKQAITRIAQMKHDALFVLCERQNEWQQKRVTIRGDVHQIPPLDDIEIERLLDLLGSHGELNKLYGLPRDHQTAAIRVNYNRELLVAIREATEGISFDAIIKDEFFSIEDNFARQIYAIVSCFHQSGALLRVELMAALAGCSLTELYERIRTPLSGVVAYEDINDGLTDYAIRSRHRIISTIVWNSCLSSDERDHIMHNALDNLNITYRLDKMAFNSFVFNDSMIDMLSSDESKQQFFEKACKKDPDNPFVWQHYSRMLARIKRFNAALGIIDQAIRMDASRQMLYHTKGYILQNMAKDNSNIEIARRYFGQSENVYNTALSMNARDAYCYQGIISLNLVPCNI